MCPYLLELRSKVLLGVLILDEPTAALDPEAEQALHEHFVKLVRNHACLLISHRFSTVKMADCIAVLDEGRIVEFGSHEDLLAVGGRYAQLYYVQAQKYY